MMYEPMMYQGKGVPVTMRKQPSATPTATPTATAILSPQDEHGAHSYSAQVRWLTAQEDELKHEEDGHNGRDIQDCGEQGINQGVGIADHWVTIPYARTQIIGVRLAKAIRPKPSIMGLRPRMDVASPTPSAVTSGTVIVLVVTPPES